MGDLTDGERAFLRSGGEDRSGLSADQLKELAPEPAAEPAGGSGSADPSGGALEPSPPASEPGRGPGVDPADDGLDDVVTVDEETGQARRKSGKFASKRDYVPHQALHAERERSKRLEEEARRARDESVATRERLRVLEEAARAAYQQQEPAASSPLDEEPIDPNVDVFGALEQANRRIAYLAEQQASVQTGMAANQEQESLRQSYRADAMAFARERPDFGGAYKHLLTTRAQEMQMYGYTPQQIQAALHSEEIEIVRLARKQGRRPAEYVYQLATFRGWRPDMAQPGPNPAANGHQPPAPQPAPPPAAPSPAMQRMQQQSQHRQQFTTLSGGGGSPTSGLTLAALADMPQGEFERVRRELGEDGMQQLLGRR